MEKKKIAIISSNYPYGNSETFLHNEILFLSEFFDIKVFPSIKKKETDIPRALPKNVTFSSPILENDHVKRFCAGVFNQSPILPYLKDLLSLLKNSKDLKGSVKNWYLNLISFRSLHSSKSISEIFEGFDIVYFYWCRYPIKFFYKKNKKIMVRVHGGEIDFVRRRGYIPLPKERFIMEDNVIYLPISDDAKQKIEFFGAVNIYLNRLGVYDNGLGITPTTDKIRIVSCSNLIPLKRINLIVSALTNIDDVEVEWIHFGDGPLLSTLRKSTNILGENISVKFAGRVDNNVIINYYQENEIDLFVNVSETEGVPVSIMEALSFGIPCFATDVGGTKELVNDSNGHLVSVNFEIIELENIIRNIKALTSSSNLRENARKTWELKCSAEYNFKSLECLFNHHLSG